MESDYRGQTDLANIIKQSLAAYEVYAEGAKPENAWERDPRTQAAVHPSAISNVGHGSKCFFVWQMSIEILAVATATLSSTILAVDTSTWSIEILAVAGATLPYQKP
jgi:hypothetical protein